MDLSAPCALPPSSPASPVGSSSSSTKFCLKWNNFGLNVTRSFSALLERGELVDLSLSCTSGDEGGGAPSVPHGAEEGSCRRVLRAHQVVLSASSAYFREMLRDLPPGQQPVFLLDVPFADLQGIVHFIYNGEVSVDQEQLPSFLKTAQMLRVKGLTDDVNGVQQSGKRRAEEEEEEDKEEEDEEEEEPQVKPPLPFPTGLLPQALLGLQHPVVAPPPPSQTTNTTTHRPRKSPHPKKNAARSPQPKVARRDSTSDPSSFSNGDNDNDSATSEPGVFAGEIDDREEEEIAAVQAMQQQQQAQAAAAQAAVNLMQQFMTTAASGDAGGQVTASAVGMEGGPDRGQQLQDVARPDHGAFPIGGLDSDALSMAFPNLKNLSAITGQQQTSAPATATTTSEANSSLKKTCPYCFQQLSWHALSRHIRDMHKSKTTFVTCKHCFKVFRNKNSLGCHMWRFHKDKTGGQDGKGKGVKEDEGKEGVMNV